MRANSGASRQLKEEERMYKPILVCSVKASRKLVLEYIKGQSQSSRNMFLKILLERPINNRSDLVLALPHQSVPRCEERGVVEASCSIGQDLLKHCLHPTRRASSPWASTTTTAVITAATTRCCLLELSIG